MPFYSACSSSQQKLAGSTETLEFQTLLQTMTYSLTLSHTLLHFKWISQIVWTFDIWIIIMSLLLAGHYKGSYTWGLLWWTSVITELQCSLLIHLAFSHTSSLCQINLAYSILPLSLWTSFILAFPLADGPFRLPLLHVNCLHAYFLFLFRLPAGSLVSFQLSSTCSLSVVLLQSIGTISI